MLDESIVRGWSKLYTRKLDSILHDTITQTHVGRSLVATTDAKREAKVAKASIRRHEEKTIVIPEGWSYDDGIAALDMAKQHEATQVNLNEDFLCYPTEGAVAFTKALNELYGFTKMVGTPGMFGETPPQLVSVETSYGMRESVPFSRVQLPGVPHSWIQPGMKALNGRVIFTLTARTIEKYRKQFETLIERTRWYTLNESIYKGQAIRVEFGDITRQDFDPFSCAPKFIDSNAVTLDDVVFSNEVMTQLDIGLFTPIRAADQLWRIRTKFRRGVLLFGPYGTGKTMVGAVCANLCAKAGITYIDLVDVGDLAAAIEFSKPYDRVLIFAEDLDRKVGHERTDEVNEIANTIDGISSKSRELMVVVTTNHIEKIHDVVLREGRFDHRIYIRQPDADAVRRLIIKYGGVNIDPKGDYSAAAAVLENQTPATIREALQRAMLAALRHGYNVNENDSASRVTVSGQDMFDAAVGLMSERGLIREMKDAAQPKSVVEQFADNLASSTVKYLRSNFMRADGREEDTSVIPYALTSKDAATGIGLSKRKGVTVVDPLSLPESEVGE